MRPFVAVLSARFRALLQYRAAALAGLGTQVFWGLIQIMVFEAFFASSSATQPMQLRDVVTYIWLKQALLLLLPWGPDPEVRALVRSGNVAYELLRPVDLYWLWYARAIAMRTAPALLRCFPMLVIAYAFFGLELPRGFVAGATFALSILAAVLLSAAMTTLLSVSTLFTIEGRGVQALTTSVVNLFSGSLVPLVFFPGWFIPLADFLPFRGLMDTPFRLYLAEASATGVAAAVGHQLLWTAVLIWSGRALLRVVTRRIALQGG